MAPFVRAVLFALLVASGAAAQSPTSPAIEAPATGAIPDPTDPAEATPLVVAVRESPPFALRDAAGEWQGLSVALWRDVAAALDRESVWREIGLNETFDALEDGTVDVAIAALTVTSERERRIDFSHPYLVSGLTLAYRAGAGSPWIDTLRSFLGLEFLSAVASLSLVLLAAGLAVWLFERRRNPEQFGGSPLHGLGSGFWWSAVTMTTVGYGDKAPRTVGGRVVGLVWMFASMLIVASFTAAIAASITVNRLGSDLLRGRPLGELTIGVVEGSAAEAYAEARGVRVRPSPDVEDALAAVAAGRVDAALYDEPILRYLQRTEPDLEIALAPNRLVRDDYAFALPEGSALREPVNRAIVSILHTPVWREITARYLGAEEE